MKAAIASAAETMSSRNCRSRRINQPRLRENLLYERLPNRALGNEIDLAPEQSRQFPLCGKMLDQPNFGIWQELDKQIDVAVRAHLAAGR